MPGGRAALCRVTLWPWPCCAVWQLLQWVGERGRWSVRVDGDGEVICVRPGSLTAESQEQAARREA
eukprot:gene10597-biopygen2248